MGAPLTNGTDVRGTGFIIGERGLLIKTPIFRGGFLQKTSPI